MKTTKKDSKQSESVNLSQERRDGRKSVMRPESYNGKNKVRYVEGTSSVQKGCCLSK